MRELRVVDENMNRFMDYTEWWYVISIVCAMIDEAWYKVTRMEYYYTRSRFLLQRVEGEGMSGNYWIKLYHEILDDPKMATLPDRLWRRVIELFLIAGRLYEDGNLPETNQIAWTLRMNTDDLAMDMQQIATTGIVERTVNGWMIPKFATTTNCIDTCGETISVSQEKTHRRILSTSRALRKVLRNALRMRYET